MGDNIFEGYEPIYVQISKLIKQEVREEKFSYGEKLPTEAMLVERFETSRGTIRKALALLNTEGVIETIHGKGSFVTNQKISSPIAQQLVSISEGFDEQNLEYETKVLKKEIINSTESSMQYILTTDDNSEILYIERLRTIDGEPSILLRNWISLERCQGIEKYDFNITSLFDAMESVMNERINYGIRSFHANNASPEIKELLKLEKDAVLKLEQTTYNQSNQPIEYSNIYIRTDRYQVTSKLKR